MKRPKVSVVVTSNYGIFLEHNPETSVVAFVYTGRRDFNEFLFFPSSLRLIDITVYYPKYPSWYIIRQNT